MSRGAKLIQEQIDKATDRIASLAALASNEYARHALTYGYSGSEHRAEIRAAIRSEMSRIVLVGAGRAARRSSEGDR